MKTSLIVDVLVIMLCFLCGYVAVFIKFTNPTMTETQLLIEFWDKWIVLIIILLLGSVAHIRWGSRKN